MCLKWMQFTIQKLYTIQVDSKTEGKFLLLAKVKKEALDLSSHPKLLKN